MEDYHYILQDIEKSKILSRIVAHLMGDGHINHRYLRYNNKEEFLLNQFQNDMGSLFKDLHFIKGKVNSGTSFVQVQNKPIIFFLNSLAPDFRSYNLLFPKFVNNLELKREFLKALYDDEGCVGLRTFKKTNEIKRDITFSSNSLKLIEEIKNMLKEDFDITSNKVSKYVKTREDKIFTNYVLAITGKYNFESFRDEIGFYHPIKANKLNLMINSYIRPPKFEIRKA
ncbi:MAG: LAGLIDADG family homing endonuclease [Nanoarchaeota archaeon]